MHQHYKKENNKAYGTIIDIFNRIAEYDLDLERALEKLKNEKFILKQMNACYKKNADSK